jgi:hypothetical protein
MRVANTLTVIGAVLCAAGCGSEPAQSEEQSNPQAPVQSSTAGSVAAPQAGKPASGASGTGAQTSASTMQSSAPKAGSAAAAAPTAGAASNPRDVAQAGAPAGAAGQSAAAGSGGGAAGAPAAAAGSSAPVATEKFSFFVTSLQGMRDLSKSENGFGGDLRYGQPTGLEGADKICTDLAEQSMPGAAGKGWHAFLSAAKGGEGGGPVHAKDRIGKGPWYDRTGRLVAMTLDNLLKERPVGADPAIIDDLPNERGEPNHTDTVPEMDDNHDVVTATNAQGMYDGKITCQDWTSTETVVTTPADPMMMMGPWGNIPMDGPGLGHSWPSEFSGISWMTVHRAPGCGASVALVQTGAGMGTGIGNAGGYGGIYCFALMP